MSWLLERLPGVSSACSLTPCLGSTTHWQGVKELLRVYLACNCSFTMEALTNWTRVALWLWLLAPMRSTSEHANEQTAANLRLAWRAPCWGGAWSCSLDRQAWHLVVDTKGGGAGT